MMIGQFVTLNSGSPRLLVVDVQLDEITVAWPSSAGIEERTFSADCLTLDRLAPSPSTP